MRVGTHETRAALWTRFARGQNGSGRYPYAGATVVIRELRDADDARTQTEAPADAGAPVN